jgi:hypothetical protein
MGFAVLVQCRIKCTSVMLVPDFSLQHAPSTSTARKEMGLTEFKHRRLSADVQRTLESVYSRTPFPTDEVIKCAVTLPPTIFVVIMCATKSSRIMRIVNVSAATLRCPC